MKKCINVNFFNLLQLKRINKKKNKIKMLFLQFFFDVSYSKKNLSSPIY
jgi:hypothetical protein